MSDVEDTPVIVAPSGYMRRLKDLMDEVKRFAVMISRDPSNEVARDRFQDKVNESLPQDDTEHEIYKAIRGLYHASSHNFLGIVRNRACNHYIFFANALNIIRAFDVQDYVSMTVESDGRYSVNARRFSDPYESDYGGRGGRGGGRGSRGGRGDRADRGGRGGRGDHDDRSDYRDESFERRSSYGSRGGRGGRGGREGTVVTLDSIRDLIRSELGVAAPPIEQVLPGYKKKHPKARLDTPPRADKNVDKNSDKNSDKNASIFAARVDNARESDERNPKSGAPKTEGPKAACSKVPKVEDEVASPPAEAKEATETKPKPKTAAKPKPTEPVDVPEQKSEPVETAKPKAKAKAKTEAKADAKADVKTPVPSADPKPKPSAKTEPAKIGKARSWADDDPVETDN